jgi:uncharacterized protein (TIGR02453 family)
MINKDTLDFLQLLESNNNRAWFEKNKDKYLKSKKNLDSFILKVNNSLSKTDEIEYSRLHRIYRDVRFSKDKLPYKSWFAGYLRRFGNDRRGGYTFRIKPGGSSNVGGGFFAPNSDDLLRIRKEFEMDSQYMNKIMTNDTFLNTFEILRGDGVKTAPRGFDKKDPNIELIRKKQFYVFKKFTDKEVLSPNFLEQVNETFLAIRPFFDYMTDILTTDLNGESIL